MYVTVTERMIERFSIDFCKHEAKVTNLANRTTCRQSNEPIWNLKLKYLAGANHENNAREQVTVGLGLILREMRLIST